MMAYTILKEIRFRLTMPISKRSISCQYSIEIEWRDNTCTFQVTVQYDSTRVIHSSLIGKISLVQFTLLKELNLSNGQKSHQFGYLILVQYCHLVHLSNKIF